MAVPFDRISHSLPLNENKVFGEKKKKENGVFLGLVHGISDDTSASTLGPAIVTGICFASRETPAGRQVCWGLFAGQHHTGVDSDQTAKCILNGALETPLFFFFIAFFSLHFLFFLFLAASLSGN